MKSRALVKLMVVLLVLGFVVFFSDAVPNISASPLYYRYESNNMVLADGSWHAVRYTPLDVMALDVRPWWSYRMGDLPPILVNFPDPGFVEPQQLAMNKADLVEKMAGEAGISKCHEKMIPADGSWHFVDAHGESHTKPALLAQMFPTSYYYT